MRKIVDMHGNEVQPPEVPDWHRQINPDQLIMFAGQWLEFVGIDPAHDMNIVIFRWKGPAGKNSPTKATQRRK